MNSQKRLLSKHLNVSLGVGGAHLDRMDPGLGAADALHRGDGGSVKLAERQEAGVGRVMSEAAVKKNLRGLSGSLRRVLGSRLG